MKPKQRPLQEKQSIRLMIFYKNIAIERKTTSQDVMFTINKALQEKVNDRIKLKLLFFFDAENRRCYNTGDAQNIGNWIRNNRLTTVYCYLLNSKVQYSTFLKSDNRSLMSFFGDTTPTYTKKDPTLSNNLQEDLNQRLSEFGPPESEPEPMKTPQTGNFSKIKTQQQPQNYFQTDIDEYKPTKPIKMKLGTPLPRPVQQQRPPEVAIQQPKPAITNLPPKKMKLPPYQQKLRNDEETRTQRTTKDRPQTYQRPPSMPHIFASDKQLLKKPLDTYIPPKTSMQSQSQKRLLDDYQDYQIGDLLDKKRNNPNPVPNIPKNPTKPIDIYRPTLQQAQRKEETYYYRGGLPPAPPTFFNNQKQPRQEYQQPKQEFHRPQGRPMSTETSHRNRWH